MRERFSGWLPDGLGCAPVPAEDGPLDLCVWDDYDGYGSYVLRSERGEAPRIERAFSDEGFFVADDGGALGYVGGCAASPRVASDEERNRRYGEVVIHREDTAFGAARATGSSMRSSSARRRRSSAGRRAGTGAQSRC